MRSKQSVLEGVFLAYSLKNCWVKKLSVSERKRQVGIEKQTNDDFNFWQICSRFAQKSPSRQLTVLARRHIISSTRTLKSKEDARPSNSGSSTQATAPTANSQQIRQINIPFASADSCVQWTMSIEHPMEKVSFRI
jgi:hypothetical protein